MHKELRVMGAGGTTKDTKQGRKAAISPGNICDEKRHAEQKTSEINNTLDNSAFTAVQRETRRGNNCLFYTCMPHRER